MSGYIERTIVTELPTTLEAGREVYYEDANGNLTLWVGHADGSAWPAVGYKEIRISLIYQAGGSIPDSNVLKNDFGSVVTITESFTGTIRIALDNIDTPASNSYFTVFLSGSNGDIDITDITSVVASSSPPIPFFVRFYNGVTVQRPANGSVSITFVYIAYE